MKRWTILLLVVATLNESSSILDILDIVDEVSGITETIIDTTGEVVEITKDILGAFEQFTLRFDKTYPSSKARKQGLLYFAKELLSIRRHNNLFRLGIESYVRKINQFSDASLEQKNRRLSGFRATKPVKPSLSMAFGLVQSHINLTSISCIKDH